MSDFIDLVSADAVPDHPATFTASIVDVFLKELLVEQERFDHRLRVLDPFAGRGGIHELDPWFDTVGVELEPEWANAHPHTEQGDATCLRFADDSFDVVATSPSYSNRMSDGYDGRDGSKRHTYRIALGRPLSENSGASLQWGCVGLGTRVLRGDWRWVEVEQLKVGDAIVGFDEHVVDMELSMRQRGRRWRMGVVEDVGLAYRDSVRVVFNDGVEVVCTTDHPWLARRPNSEPGGSKRTVEWVEAKRLKPGYVLGVYLPTWDESRSYDAGWLAGIFDGEGSYSHSYGSRPGSPASQRLSVAQKPGVVLDRMVELLDDFGVITKTYSDRAVVKIDVNGGLARELALMGAIRPERLLAKIDIDGQCLRARSERVVVEVEPMGLQQVVLMGTSCRTYLTEGMGSHNTNYRDLHTKALLEMQRVVAPGGLILLNMSDHIRKGEVQPVVQWYVDTMNEIGLTVEREIPVPTPRLSHGANAELRAEHEVVIVARR